MQHDFASVFAWACVALLVVVLAGWQAVRSDDTSAVPVVQAAEGEAAPAEAVKGDTTPTEAIGGGAPAAPERTAAEVFKGTNLLEGAWEKLPKGEKAQPADNSYCYVCHANYQEEALSKSHMSLGIGCESCHGMSDEHSADEDGLTPPEIMWPKEWINVTCMECHPRAALVKQDGHREFLSEPFPDEVCTDCHGEQHRLKVRTRVWDKRTAKLLQCDGVRMMDADSPAGAAK
ncbi:MAG: multiheme c-type cytochrome [Patescibacteria group bacterium]|nr:multiheme c-type cytochrome [Patescibacteria group bacterium]